MFAEWIKPIDQMLYFTTENFTTEILNLQQKSFYMIFVSAKLEPSKILLAFEDWRSFFLFWN